MTLSTSAAVASDGMFVRMRSSAALWPGPSSFLFAFVMAILSDVIFLWKMEMSEPDRVDVYLDACLEACFDASCNLVLAFPDKSVHQL